MRRPRLLVLAGLVAGLTFAGGGAALLAAGGGDRSSQPRNAASRTLGFTPASTPVRFSVVLAQRRQAELERFLRQLHDPSSPNYRRFLSPAELGRRFGLPAAEIRRVRGTLRAAGVRVVRGYAQRTQLEARATAGEVARLFRTRLVERVDARGQRYRTPVRPVTVPPSLGASVDAVAGLDTRRFDRPDAIPAGGLRPRDAAEAYDVAPLHRRNIRGQGQTVAIISFDTFDPADIAAFERRMGIRGAPPVQRVSVQGGVSEPGDGEIEVALDIEIVRGIAPRARIINYESGGGAGMAPVLNRIIDDRKADIASLSWSRCDLLNQDIPELAPVREAERRAVQRMAAAGISLFSSAGDTGAYHCQRRDPADDRLSVGWPNSSPWAISIGGTLLDVRRNGGYGVESGWEDTLSRGGGGGGLSSVERQAPWQRGRGVRNRFSNGRRQLPDVSASSDGTSGWFIIVDGEETQVGGTSAATPFWASSMALVRQNAQREGVRRLGFVAPVLYRVAALRDSPFHDVRLGGNRYYDAGPGWDFSTGLGSPDVAKLADAVTDELKRG